ncbi:MAG: monovalent cation/H(+) antiporter subunit G [Deltaproteobacteria bacterium]|nr:monovalent cation/H(+) antiporter subunit G [Deltaproteobacteria bacterium]
MILEILSGLLILAGLFLFASGTLGLLRLPDFYCRMHATGKCDTLGALFALLGLAVYHGFSPVSLKILFIVVFIFLANPTATHAIGRAALVNRVQPWTKESSSNAPSVASSEEEEK